MKRAADDDGRPSKRGFWYRLRVRLCESAAINLEQISINALIVLLTGLALLGLEPGTASYTVGLVTIGVAGTTLVTMILLLGYCLWAENPESGMNNS
jgi:hypothetical protein